MNGILMPIVAAQGIWVRSTIKLAEPATGPTHGTVVDGSGPPVRLGVLGDSTAAGCGVRTHDEGFPACLATQIAARSGRPVAWTVAGLPGATARRIRHHVLPRLEGEFDVAVVLAGGNDVLSQRSLAAWEENLSAIVADLSVRAKQVVVPGIPPFALFPSLPHPLGRYLGERAAAFDEIGQRVCACEPRAAWVGTTGTPPPGFFCRDRFHPSASGYRHWAEMVVPAVAL
ncbi:MAG TPA: SGNH/GDSL hydrolase family protein [Candidatus Limnocylindrales bacterium]|nr:SGNH/GDSL hydrolase family protein [Candidatus Limnocylindrales bacterium]